MGALLGLPEVSSCRPRTTPPPTYGYSSPQCSATVLKGAGPVRLKYIKNVQTPYKFTKMFPNIRNEAQGNYWLRGTRSTQNWYIIEQTLREEIPMTGST
jgi:hypothetical protein